MKPGDRMKVGDLVRFKHGTMNGSFHRNSLFIVIEDEPPPHDRNDVWKIQDISKLGSEHFERCYIQELEVIS